MGSISYEHSESPIQAELEAYSPFVPLNLKDSTIPVTVLSYRLTNTSDQPVSAELVGWLENMSHAPEKNTEGTFSSKMGLSSLSHHCEMKVRASRKVKQEVFHKGSMALSYLGDAKQTSVDQIPGLAADVVLKPGQSQEFTFLISWHFPVVRVGEQLREPLVAYENEYSYRFKDANAVAEHVAENFASLSSQTLQWVDTWNDSTLPQWLLDRTIVTSDTLQTANCFLLGDRKGGRFWAWEGIGVCHGTCTHVWHYAQGMARLFPSLERQPREKTDFGFAQLPNGVVPFRATVQRQKAVGSPSTGSAAPSCVPIANI